MKIESGDLIIWKDFYHDNGSLIGFVRIVDNENDDLTLCWANSRKGSRISTYSLSVTKTCIDRGAWILQKARKGCNAGRTAASL